MGLLQNKKPPAKKHSNFAKAMARDVNANKIIDLEVKKSITLPKSKDKEARQNKRLEIVHEALRGTFLLFSLVLLLSFLTACLFGSLDIFSSVTLSIIISGLFGVLTLLVGVVAGTSID